MEFKLKDKQKVTQHILNQRKRIEAALIYRLEFLIAELTNHAKTSAGYQDRTSNLKSSIGGVLLKDRIPISYKGFIKEASNVNGDSGGIGFIQTLFGQQPSGYVILVVAGMEYATYVEDHHNLNVLKQTELKMISDLPGIISKLKMQYENTK